MAVETLPILATFLGPAAPALGGEWHWQKAVLVTGGSGGVAVYTQALLSSVSSHPGHRAVSSGAPTNTRPHITAPSLDSGQRLTIIFRTWSNHIIKRSKRPVDAQIWNTIHFENVLEGTCVNEWMTIILLFFLLEKKEIYMKPFGFLPWHMHCFQSAPIFYKFHEGDVMDCSRFFGLSV